MYVRLTQPYLVVSQCDTMEKNVTKNSKSDAHSTVIYLYIPAIPRYRYTVCCGVPKSTTVPIPTLPVLENPWVFPYPCGTPKQGAHQLTCTVHFMRLFNRVCGVGGTHCVHLYLPRLYLLMLVHAQVCTCLSLYLLLLVPACAHTCLCSFVLACTHSCPAYSYLPTLIHSPLTSFLPMVLFCIPVKLVSTLNMVIYLLYVVYLGYMLNNVSI